MLAYLDAGSASLIVSAIAAGVAGAAVFFRMQVRRVRRAFARVLRPGSKRSEA